MAEKLKKRPIRIDQDKKFNPTDVEQIFRHFDENMLELDRRRIDQASKAETKSTDSETVTELVTKLNALIDALNGSDLTND